jgi:hypothetical protein
MNNLLGRKMVEKLKAQETTDVLEARMVFLTGQAMQSSGNKGWIAVKALENPKFADVDKRWAQFAMLTNIAKHAKSDAVNEEALKAVREMAEKEPKFAEMAHREFGGKFFALILAGPSHVDKLIQAAIKGDEKTAFEALGELKSPYFKLTEKEKLDALTHIIANSPHKSVKIESFGFALKKLENIPPADKVQCGREFVIAMSTEPEKVRVELTIGKAKMNEQILEHAKNSEDLRNLFDIMKTAPSGTIGPITDVTLKVVKEDLSLLDEAKKRVNSLLEIKKNREDKEALANFKLELDQLKP